jgi:hypothetical protein
MSRSSGKPTTGPDNGRHFRLIDLKHLGVGGLGQAVPLDDAAHATGIAQANREQASEMNGTSSDR